MDDKIENKINELGYALMGADEALGLKSKLIVVIEEPGKAIAVGVFQNGILQETPLRIGIVATEAAELARISATSRFQQAIRSQFASTEPFQKCGGFGGKRE